MEERPVAIGIYLWQLVTHNLDAAMRPQATLDHATLHLEMHTP